MKNTSSMKRFVSAGIPVSSYKDFLIAFRDKILELPEINASVISYMDSLSYEQRQAWITILPVAAQFRKNSESGEDAVKKAMHWCIKSIDEVLVLEK